jgi:hypothetical protein
MQKNQVDALVESFFKPQQKKDAGQMSLDDLIAVINEVKSTLPSLVLEAGGNRMNIGGPPIEPKMGGSSGTPATISWESIPEISVSELGWANLNTTDTGDKVSGPERQRLEQYLANIQGQTFAQKIQSISGLFTMSEEEIKNSEFLTGATNADKIQKTLAYLVFLKTLTTIITNFNAASAGFSFEAFLGVLLGGRQVPTGGGTIADLYAGDDTPISLKLYAEDGLTVGGSFTDLVGDMVKPKTSVELMRYVIVTKSLTGEGLNKEGEIKVYEFDIKLDNIAEVMMLSENGELLRLPVSFLQNPEGTDVSSLKNVKITVNQEEVEKQFLDSLVSSLGNDIANILFAAVKEQSDELPVFTKTKAMPDPKIGFSTFTNQFITSVPTIIQAKTDRTLTPDEEKKAREALKLASTKAKQYVEQTKGSSAIQARDKQLQELQFASAEESYEAYQSYPPEIKKKALVNSYGYLYTEQFEMTKNQVFSVMQRKKLGRGGEASKPIGVIKIGSKNLQDIMNKLAVNLNAAILEIFTNLSQLTRSLNSYFATGLRDGNAASTAQSAAQNIDKKTEEVKIGK